MPDNRLYPKGRVFPFLGYSGNAAWQKTNGYTAFGPVFGGQASQQEALGQAKAAGLPFVYAVGLEMNFLGKDGKTPVEMGDREVQKAILEQARGAMSDAAVCWWYVVPEELRYWVPKEIGYLGAVRKALLEDPMQRPVWMYEPNQRDAAALAQTGKFQDIVGMGSYVNYAGYADNRVWVRWSMEQQTDAMKMLRRKNGLALVMPELSADPPAGQEAMIPVWARHDVYCGLANGGRGVVIWSLFKRREVANTHEQWMSAYATVARELTGPLGLGQVFLFGEDRNDLTFSFKQGPAKVELVLGGAKGEEAGSAPTRERRNNALKYPSVSIANRALGKQRYVFLTNDTAESVSLEVKGFPRGCRIESLFDGREIDSASGTLVADLTKWGAVGLRLSAE